MKYLLWQTKYRVPHPPSETIMNLTVTPSAFPAASEWQAALTLSHYLRQLLAARPEIVGWLTE
ncbi:MAG: hypothetical protein JZU63_02880, partial [Rhodoferax sp.]|nr:hypothetical protein [Rhodoferax sp.]